MSKELTEKWKNKELKDGDYYVINKAGDIVCDYYIEILGHFDSVLTENVKEVLAPVPSYNDYKKLRRLPLKCFQLEEDNSALMVINKDMCKEIERLQKKLEITTKALKEYSWGNNWIDAGCRGQVFLPTRRGYSIADKALEEMEGVK